MLSFFNLEETENKSMSLEHALIITREMEHSSVRPVINGNLTWIGERVEM